MFAALALAFLVVPFLELLVLIQVGREFGAVPTVAALILVSVVGAALVKRQGVGVYRRARLQMAMGEVPGTEIVDGLLILFAGALLLTPGFLTDLLGLSLLVPAFRGVLRRGARRTIAGRVRVERW